MEITRKKMKIYICPKCRNPIIEGFDAEEHFKASYHPDAWFLCGKCDYLGSWDELIKDTISDIHIKNGNIIRAGV